MPITTRQRKFKQKNNHIRWVKYADPYGHVASTNVATGYRLPKISHNPLSLSSCKNLKFGIRHFCAYFPHFPFLLFSLISPSPCGFFLYIVIYIKVMQRTAVLPATFLTPLFSLDRSPHSAIGYRLSAIGYRLSAIGYRASPPLYHIYKSTVSTS